MRPKHELAGIVAAYGDLFMSERPVLTYHKKYSLPSNDAGQPLWAVMWNVARIVGKNASHTTVAATGIVPNVRAETVINGLRKGRMICWTVNIFM